MRGERGEREFVTCVLNTILVLSRLQLQGNTTDISDKRHIKPEPEVGMSAKDLNDVMRKQLIKSKAARVAMNPRNALSLVKSYLITDQRSRDHLTNEWLINVDSSALYMKVHTRWSLWGRYRAPGSERGTKGH